MHVCMYIYLSIHLSMYIFLYLKLISIYRARGDDGEHEVLQRRLANETEDVIYIYIYIYIQDRKSVV